MVKVLEGDSAYHCDRCAAKVTARKRLALHRLPEAWVVHVNRAVWHFKGACAVRLAFYQRPAVRLALEFAGKKEKLQTHVTFPLSFSAADLTPFLSAEAREAYIAAPANGSGSGEVSSVRAQFTHEA